MYRLDKMFFFLGISAPMDFGHLNLHDETIFNVSKHPNTVALNAEIMDDGEEKQRNNVCTYI